MPVRIGELLLKEKRITPDQLQEALNYQKANGGKLGYHLVKLGIVQDEEITSLLSKQYGVPSINLTEFEIDPSVIRLVPAETAQKYQILPLSRSGATLTIAMTDPTNVFAMDDIKFMTGYNVEPVVASEVAMLDAIQKYYSLGKPGSNGQQQSALELASRVLEDMPQIDATDVEVLEELEEISVEALAKQGEEAPVVRLVNVMLMSAIHKGASDIHIEPYEKELRIRYRVDGVLYNIMAPPMKFRDPIASRVKIMAKLDIAEKRLPQDGRIKIRYNDNGHSKEIDFRVSSLPTLFGEKIVLRLLDKNTLMLDMTRLGFESESLVKFEKAILKPYGMVLVTGPTGSGKTNTLYSSISRINKAETNILTAEDPIEFNLAGINQVQIKEGIGLNFAAALRSFLRQDPNIILVGEIRDFETAEIAVKAALTGHLVLSTLHTNDAPSSITRLLDLGVPHFLITSTLIGVVAQRLVRENCPHCLEEYEPTEAEAAAMKIPFEKLKPYRFRRGKGCLHCRETGFLGRTGVYEILPMTEKIRRLVSQQAGSLEIFKAAREEGLRTLKEAAIEKVFRGVTTTTEMVRVTGK